MKAYRQYKQTQFEHKRDEKMYRKYFPVESGIGELIGTIYEKMGESNASILFRGTKRGLPYTLKVYKKKLPQSPEEIKGRMQQLTSLGPHPRVCQVLDFLDYEGEAGSFSYVKMEFANGVGLDTALRNEPGHKFPQNVVLNWAWQLLEALSFLHENNLSVHIKLSNIVLLRHDNSVRISDISHLVSQVDNDRNTVNNIPDDQLDRTFFATAKKTVDAGKEVVAVDYHENQVRRDIFHLGSVLFELLTGFQPNKYGWSNEEKKYRLKSNGVSADVADIIVKAIDAERMSRWKSAEEMMDALKYLPMNESHNVAHCVSVFHTILFAVFGFLLGLLLFSIGRYEERRSAEMEQLTLEAEANWQKGRYTDAWASLGDALSEQSKFDPELKAETLRAAADYLGVYKLSDGYSPWYSKEMSGFPIAAAISPDSNQAAVMTRDVALFSSDPIRRIHLIDPSNGQELGAAQTNSFSAPDMAFIGDDSLAYINELGNFAVYYWNVDSYNQIELGSPVVRLAFSGNHAVAACLCQDNSVYVVRIDHDGAQLRLSLIGMVGSRGDAEDYSQAPENRLFAMDETGERLVISLTGKGTDGGALLRVYTIGESKPREYQISHHYDHFEGGFYQDCVALVGWAINKDMGGLDPTFENAYISGFHAFLLNGDATPLNRLYYHPVHAHVDENGIYWSHKGEVERLSLTKDSSGTYNTWLHHAPQSMAASVRFLQRIPGYTLVGLSNQTVHALKDNEEESLAISSGISFSGAAASKDYLLLYEQGGNEAAYEPRNTLSVLKWQDTNVFLQYSASEFQHQRYQVLEDKSAAVLFGLNRETTKIFNVWKAGSNAEDAPIPGEILHNPTDVRNCVYLKPITQDDPPGEYLKVAYYAHDDEYYSASTGKLEQPSKRYRSEVAEANSLYTQDYLLKKSASDKIDVFQADGALLGQISASGTMVDACQCDDAKILFVSLRESEKTPYCLLLDSNFEILARMQGDYTVLRDGTLYRDDGNGTIFCGKIYSKAALREEITELEDVGR